VTLILLSWHRLLCCAPALLELSGGASAEGADDLLNAPTGSGRPLLLPLQS
jgi:hypothetical protein